MRDRPKQQATRQNDRKKIKQQHTLTVNNNSKCIAHIVLDNYLSLHQAKCDEKKHTHKQTHWQNKKLRSKNSIKFCAFSIASHTVWLSLLFFVCRHDRHRQCLSLFSIVVVFFYNRNAFERETEQCIADHLSGHIRVLDWSVWF